ncbi:hypothetical protein [Lewinella sp. LCG006]|uniref:hypothetical protein n=1 Tax=Lewinella sp. LCG006 TaxID=3231911 RepID=UPI00345F92D6
MLTRMLQRCVVSFMLCLIGFIPRTIQSDEAPRSGQWLGKLTQEQGGYRQEYDFELYLTAKNDRYAGRTYVYAPNVLGVLSFTGQQRGAVLYLKEEELLISRKPSDLSWCFKTMQLRQVKRGDDWYLEGPWQGTSEYGICIPGWLSLKYIPPKV